MRKILIDTDTASDDAVALIAALRDPNVHVEAITVVAGNVPIDLAVKNALISVEMAGTYTPPVYKGAGKPLLRPLFTSEFVHGSDGMGEMHLPDPALRLTPGHAVDVIIDTVMRSPGEVEIITLGPLTNLALAVSKEPAIAQQVKRVVVMGGNGYGPGNVSPLAEFNFFVDAEAAQIVLQSGMPLLLVGWDVSTDETFISEADMARWLAGGSERAQFSVRCNATLRQHNIDVWGKVGFDLPDPVAVIAALYPDIITEQVTAYCYVEYRSPEGYGHQVIDRHNLVNRPANATICLRIDARRFKDILFERVQ